MIFSLKLLIAAAIIQQVQSQHTNSISVGGFGLEFSHPSVPAVPGDVIAFLFKGQNHSVVQGSFENPCHPLPGGFYSGFFPAAPGAQGASSIFLLKIKDTRPIYYYCGQIGHCQAGMVGVINAPCNGSDTFIDFQNAATQVTSVGPIPSSVSGGQIIPASPYPSSLGEGTISSGAIPTSATSFVPPACYATPSSASTSSNTSTASIQQITSSGGKSIYGGGRFGEREATGLLWQAVFQVGIVTAVVQVTFVA